MRGGPEVTTITMDGVSVIETESLSEAWVTYPNGGLMKIGISTPDTLTIEQRRESLKGILRSLGLIQ